MKQKIVVSNVRFPIDEWMQLKFAASSMNMSNNEYLRQVVRADSIKSLTGSKKVKLTGRAKAYAALDAFLEFAKTHKARPMGANEDDKIIYDID